MIDASRVLSLQPGRTKQSEEESNPRPSRPRPVSSRWRPQAASRSNTDSENERMATDSNRTPDLGADRLAGGSRSSRLHHPNTERGGHDPQAIAGSARIPSAGDAAVASCSIAIRKAGDSNPKPQRAPPAFEAGAAASPLHLPVHQQRWHSGRVEKRQPADPRADRLMVCQSITNAQSHSDPFGTALGTA